MGEFYLRVSRLSLLAVIPKYLKYIHLSGIDLIYLWRL